MAEAEARRGTPTAIQSDRQLRAGRLTGSERGAAGSRHAWTLMHARRGGGALVVGWLVLAASQPREASRRDTHACTCGERAVPAATASKRLRRLLARRGARRARRGAGQGGRCGGVVCLASGCVVYGPGAPGRGAVYTAGAAGHAAGAVAGWQACRRGAPRNRRWGCAILVLSSGGLARSGYFWALLMRVPVPHVRSVRPLVAGVSGVRLPSPLPRRSSGYPLLPLMHHLMRRGLSREALLLLCSPHGCLF